MTTPTGDALGYAAAISELERILADLEADDVDVDVLAAKVARAAELLRVCRDRLQAARFEVESVLGELAGPDDPHRSTSERADGDGGGPGSLRHL